jgi:PAS domain S-box-containing protein
MNHYPPAADPSTPVAKAPITALLQDLTSTMLTQGVFWRKDGTSFPVEYSIAPIWERHKLVGTVVTFKDSTERKHAEETQAFLAAIVESSEDVIIGKNLDGIILSWNTGAEHLYGYRAAEVINQPITMLVPPDRTDEIRQILARIKRGEQITHYETERCKKDRTPFTVSLTISPIRDATGAITGASTIARDITMRKRLEDQLVQTQKLESLGVLAGGIAHDFNNLLVAIVGNAGLALMELPPESPQREYLDHIERTAQRAAELTRQMLAYAGKGRFVVEQLNLNTIVEDMLDLLQAANPKNVVLRLHLATDLPMIEGDVTQLRQVFMNLVINGADAIGSRSGIVSITTGRMWVDRRYLTDAYLAPNLAEGEYVYVEVADTGCGMDATTRAKIFEPFFTTKATGRGLGLAAVLGIVRGHQGALKIYSEPGRGSTFKFLLPGQTRKSEAQAVRSSEVWRHGTGTVLLIDDEEDVRVVVGRMLEWLGFEVLTAADGREGVELFRTQQAPIICVLMDMTMPHLSGPETYRQIQQLQADVRVILMSGYNEQEAVTQFAGKGLAGFLAKPFTPTELREKLWQALGGGEATRVLGSRT